MPLRTIAGSAVQYFLISFDENGVERPEQDGTLLSDQVRARLADRTTAITDVFLASHGWKGDVPAAIEQNDKWIGEMARAPDRRAIEQSRPGFKPLSIGLHWPSLPFGDENIPAAGEGGLLSADDDDLDARVEQYAASIANTPRARAAIRTILLAAKDDDGGDADLLPNVRAAYDELFAEAALDGASDLGAAPGADHPTFDANEMYRAARDAAGENDESNGGSALLGGGGLFDKLKGLVVMPMQQASFWRMKERARVVGESGVHSLLASLMAAAPGTVRFHLMGHSFGCIVVSAAVAGPPAEPKLPRAVDTLLLVQGALSLWSFSPDIPSAPGTSGYFNRIVQKGMVRGPIVTTRSSFDKAVGTLYPPAAKLKSQLVLGDEFPKYGGVGSFGAQGLGPTAVDATLQPATHAYHFESGRVYNLEASEIIKTGGGFSGAHSDIAHPEVAHAMWQAVAVS